MQESVNHPQWYQGRDGMETVEVLRNFLTEDEFRGCCKGQALQYIMRERKKGHDRDLKCAAWWLDECINESEPKRSPIEDLKPEHGPLDDLIPGSTLERKFSGTVTADGEDDRWSFPIKDVEYKMLGDGWYVIGKLDVKGDGK